MLARLMEKAISSSSSVSDFADLEDPRAVDDMARTRAEEKNFIIVLIVVDVNCITSKKSNYVCSSIKE